MTFAAYVDEVFSLSNMTWAAIITGLWWWARVLWRNRVAIRLDLVWRWVRLRYVVGFAWRRRHFRRGTAGHLRGRVPVESGVGVLPLPPPPRDLRVDTGKMQPLFGEAHITPEGYTFIEALGRAAWGAGFSAEDMHAAAGPLRQGMTKRERLRKLLMSSPGYDEAMDTLQGVPLERVIEQAAAKASTPVPGGGTPHGG